MIFEVGSGKGHGEKKSRKREQAIIALLTRPNVVEAAELAGIAYATLRRWMKEPAFRDDYAAARRDAMSQAVGFLQRASADAVESLVYVCRDSQAPAIARVAARQMHFGNGIQGD